jgi:asparagine synthase (glutamine-hydrolysing)
MCGIVGKLSFDGSHVDPALIRKMANTVIHRGPDDEGILCRDNIGLGQRRLSIIDLSREATAPLSNEDGSTWVIFNGEIYNFQRLRATLNALGHVFRTRTDTEVIVHLYEEYGISCLDHLVGMFAFVIWDSVLGRVFAARDRLGEKPFVYAKTAKALLFGSAIKALTVDADLSAVPDFGAIDSYLSNQYVPSPLTAFQGINKLPAAHYLTCDSSGLMCVKRYWSPNGKTMDRADENEIKAELLRTLRESVGLRMIADVPLGAFLSGGLDSSAIVALMAQQSARSIKTFSVGFEEDEFNELPYARLVAERYDTDHHEFIVRPEMTAVISELVEHYNEPFADSSALPTYYVSQQTRQHVTVALSGDGGDENFGGYSRYLQMDAFRRFDCLPRFATEGICSSIEYMALRLPPGKWTSRLARASRMVRANLPERYRIFRSILKDEEKAVLYSPHFRSLLEHGACVSEVTLGTHLEGDEQVRWMMQHDLGNYLPDCLMVKVDVASMAHSLEVRCPLLDHSIVEFAASIPTRLKIRNCTGKQIFRETVQNLLPEKILQKPKTGFAMPVSRWLRRDSGNLLRHTLLDDVAAKRGLFNLGAVNRMIDHHVAGARDWGNRLWALLILELWFRRFID